jgi:polysaccharide biosynthesis protein PslH
MSNKRPKILIALFRLPYPAIDGTRYKILNNVIEGLAPEFDLEFLIATIDDFKNEDVHYLENKFGTVHLFKRPKIQFIIGALQHLFSHKPLQVGGWFDKRVKKWVDKHIDRYDAVYIHEIRMTEYFINLPTQDRNKCVVDFNDAISHNYETATFKFPIRYVYRLEGKRIKEYETAVLHSFSHFNVVSPVDRDILLNNAGMDGPAVDFLCVPHGVKIPTIQARLSSNNQFFFMGKLDYAPNKDALRYLITVLWKKIRRTLPNAVLHIIGRGAIASDFEEKEGIEFHGFVPELSNIVSVCTALIAPIRYGAGTPSKIIEAMAFGLPVITTNVAIQGIKGAIDRENIIVCSLSNPHEWITALEKIHSDSAYRFGIGNSARKLIQENYSSDASQRAFRDLFHRIITTN